MTASFVAFGLGAASWGVFEYLIHRFLGHRPKGRDPFAVEHRAHHSKGDYFAPTRKKALAATPVILGMFALFSLVLGPEIGAPVAGGLLVTYLSYEWLHLRLHTHPAKNAYGRWARRHHFYHHFGDPRMNHGLTTPIGDFLFGTHHRPAKIRVPERLAMVWLVDPSTGDVRKELRDEYELQRLPGQRTSDIKTSSYVPSSGSDSATKSEPSRAI